MSCLFDAIGKFINIDGYTVRQKICDYLDSYKPLIDGVDTKIILESEDPHYLIKMRDPRVFGGGNEIRVACILWSLRIIVYINPQLTEVIEFIPLVGTYRYTIKLCYQNNNHYEPLMTTQ